MDRHRNPLDPRNAAMQHAAMARPPIWQNPDIRYLGRLLGDVIRAYGGERLYRQTEYIRSASVDRARGVAPPEDVDSGLSALTMPAVIALSTSWLESLSASAG